VLEESGMVPKIKLLRVRCCSYLPEGGAKAWGKGRKLNVSAQFISQVRHER